MLPIITKPFYNIGGSSSNVFAIDPTKVDDYIEITNEWQFADNSWTDLYLGEHTLKILFSEKYKLVYFDKSFKNSIHTTNTQISSIGWNIGIKYIGDRFWVPPYADNSSKRPSKAFWQGYLFSGCDNVGTSTQCMGDVAYAGEPGTALEYCGIGFKQTNGMDLNNTYGFLLSGLCLDVVIK